VLALVAALATITGPPGATQASQPSDCGPVERGALRAGQTVSGRIDDCHREEIWTFDAARDQAVVISMARPSPPTFAGFSLDPFLRLFAPGDASTSAITSNDDGGYGVDARIEIVLEASGQYRVAATSIGGTFGDYTLTLTFIGMAATERGEIRPGQTVSGRIDADNPEDAWWFDGVRGQRVLISMQKVRPFTPDSIFLDPLLFLFRPAEGGVATIEDLSDDADELDAVIMRVLEQTGRYRIVATSIGDSFGAYRLTLQIDDTAR